MSINLYNLKYFHASKRYQRNRIRLKEMRDAVMSQNPKTVLDVGCGIGVLVRALRSEGVEAIGTDFSPDLVDVFWRHDPFFQIADAKKLPFSDKSFDVVFSSDFFEHIPEDEIPVVLKEMKRVGKTVMARIAYEYPLTENQALYHVTNKPKSWWEKKLKGVILINNEDKHDH